LKDLGLSFLRLGATAFGGPAMVAYIRELAVARKGWLDEGAFRAGVALCQSLPGATAMQTVAYVGLRTRGLVGGLTTYVGFGLPAFLLMLGLSALYQQTRDLPSMLSLFHGLRVIVVAIVAHATWTFARSSCKGWREALLALLAAAALGWQVNPLLVIPLAGLLGCLLLPTDSAPAGALGKEAPGPWKALRPGLALVAVGGLAVSLLFFLDRPLFDLAAVMLRVDLFAFGGGFASVPLMQHEVVEVRRWMDARTFMDGIALGQVTPGPIVITATFVGYAVRGVLGAVVATAAIFFPSLAVLALVLPYYDRLQDSPRFRQATRGALLSFVGLLLVVTVRFGLSAHWNLPAVLLGLSALAALLRGVDILWVVLIGGLLSLLIL
jgi:chromate transporter